MFRSTPRKSLLHARRASRRREHAFTLIELLAVVAIIAILAGLVIGSVSKIRDMARRSTCTSNLRQIGAAFQLYAADNHGLYPAERQPYPAPDLSPNPNPKGDNWQAEVSRYVLRDGLLGDIKKIGADSNIAHCPSFDLLFPNATLASSNYKTAGYGMNSNLNIGGADTAGKPIPLGGSKLSISTRFPAAAIVNPAKSVLVADSSDYHIAISGNWTSHIYANTDPSSNMGKPDGYDSGAPYRHGSNANYLFADGHVVTLSPAEALLILPFKS